MIDASIFIASMVATVSPAATVSPSATLMVTTPWNGAATWPGLDVSAFSVAATSAAMLVSRTAIGRSWPLMVAITRAVAALVGLADRLEAEQQRLALVDVDLVLVALPEAVEVVERGQHRHVAVGLAGLDEVRAWGRGTAAR